MTERQGFSYVEERGFISLLEDLDKGSRWREHDSTPYENVTTAPTIPLYQRPLALQCKVRLKRGINGLLMARGVGLLDVYDASWDKTQRRLYFSVAANTADPDPAKSSAAEKIKDSPGMFLGDGLGQTRLPYEQEVDHGRGQLAMLRGGLRTEVALLGLGPIVEDVANTTEEFATALGRSSGKSSKTRAEQVNTALKECRQACNFTLSALGWHTTQPGLSQEASHELEELLAPLKALLKRYATTVPDVIVSSEDDTDGI
jgi:hypothetical protein